MGERHDQSQRGVRGEGAGYGSAMDWRSPGPIGVAQVGGRGLLPGLPLTAVSAQGEEVGDGGRHLPADIQVGAGGGQQGGGYRAGRGLPRGAGAVLGAAAPAPPQLPPPSLGGKGGPGAVRVTAAALACTSRLKASVQARSPRSPDWDVSCGPELPLPSPCDGDGVSACSPFCFNHLKTCFYFVVLLAVNSSFYS